MDLLTIARGLIGLIVLIAIAYTISADRKNINWKMVGMGLLMQFVFAFAVLKTTFGKDVFGTISKGFVTLLDFAGKGAEFVFGRLAHDSGPDSLGFFFVFKGQKLSGVLASTKHS